MDYVNFIMRFEGDDETLTQDEVIAFFQAMIDDGTVWKLQGSYGRMATALIEQGYCKAKQMASPV